MMQPDMASRLNRAIELINAGRRAEARTILLQLSQENPNSEQVWMWLSTTSENSEERIGSLRNVLKINPRNETARAALLRLTQDPNQPVRAAPARRAQPMESTLIGILLIILVIVVVVVITALVFNMNQPKPIPTSPPTNTPTTIPTLTLTPTITPGGPTLTPVVGITMPPTWTPVPSITILPSHTPKPPTITPIPSVTITLKATIPFVSTITPGGPTLTPRPPTSTVTATVPASATALPGATATAAETAQ